MSRIRKRKIAIKGMAAFLVVLILGYHFYCHYMVSRLYRCIDAGDTESTLAHIDKMPNVNMLDICFPMYYLKGILTQYGANKGYPLDYAVYKNADASIIEALLKKEADPNKVDVFSTSFQELCYHSSSDKDEKVRLMVQYGADIDSISLYIPAYFRRLGKESKEMEFNCISFLWESGVDDIAAAKTKYESTVLNDAAKYLDIDYLDRLYHNEKRAMDYLLNVKDINGETPLFSAVRSNNYGNVEFLTGEGADADIKNNEGKTAYDVAVELGYEECVEVLDKASHK